MNLAVGRTSRLDRCLQRQSFVFALEKVQVCHSSVVSLEEGSHRCVFVLLALYASFSQRDSGLGQRRSGQAPLQLLGLGKEVQGFELLKVGGRLIGCRSIVFR